MVSQLEQLVIQVPQGLQVLRAQLEQQGLRVQQEAKESKEFRGILEQRGLLEPLEQQVQLVRRGQRAQLAQALLQEQ